MNRTCNEILSTSQSIIWWFSSIEEEARFFEDSHHLWMRNARKYFKLKQFFSITLVHIYIKSTPQNTTTYRTKEKREGCNISLNSKQALNWAKHHSPAHSFDQNKCFIPVWIAITSYYRLRKQNHGEFSERRKGYLNAKWGRSQKPT